MVYKDGKYKITSIKDGGKTKTVHYGQVSFDEDGCYTVAYDGGGFATGIDFRKHYGFIRIDRDAWRTCTLDSGNEFAVNWTEYELIEEA